MSKQPPPPDIRETYLGDGLYARFDGYALWLRAPRENGDHIVAMEPREWAMLLQWFKTVHPEIEHHMGGTWGVKK